MKTKRKKEKLPKSGDVIIRGGIIVSLRKEQRTLSHLVASPTSMISLKLLYPNMKSTFSWIDERFTP